MCVENPLRVYLFIPKGLNHDAIVTVENRTPHPTQHAEGMQQFIREMQQLIGGIRYVSYIFFYQRYFPKGKKSNVRC